MNESTMRRERVTATPDWYEPYNISLAIKAGGLVYVSGQAGFDTHGNTVGDGDFEAQARQAFANWQIEIDPLRSRIEAAEPEVDVIRGLPGEAARSNPVSSRGRGDQLSASR